MEILQEIVDDVSILNLSGRLDATCVSELKKTVQTMIDAGGLKILIDMANVDFVDSSGLGTLVTCLRSVTKAGGVFKITSLQENPRMLFETTRLDRVFDIHDDRNAAISSF
jgi:anti-sigma B factor antagonist